MSRSDSCEETPALKTGIFHRNIFGWNFVNDDLVPIEYFRMV
jgi:hypothetical protein